MAKKEKKNAVSVDDAIFGIIAKELDGDILADNTPVKYFVDTGNLAFNWVLSDRFYGGGIPGGKVTEFFGPEASGKSYWGANIVRGCQAIGGIPVYLDCENSLNNEFVVKTSHIDLKRVVRFDPSKGVDSLEGCFNKIYTVIKKVRDSGDDRPIIFIYDSIASSPCARELRETEVDTDKCTKEEYKSIVGGKEQPGERARICSKELRKLGSVLEKNNASVVFLNQIRMKIGVMYGSPETTAGGGESLKFYASCRVRTSIQKKIENKKLKTSKGINLKVTNKKNRCCAPFREAEGVHLYWDDGVNPLSGLLTCLIQSERIEAAGKGMYVVKEPWAGGQEIKFQASKARNDISADVLYKCPALVDATEQEIRDYLAIFDSAIKAGNNADNEETDASSEESSDSDY
jgi:recombination protein RecA